MGDLLLDETKRKLLVICEQSMGQDRIDRIEVEIVRPLLERLELIARNASSWHHDADAKQRALNVIAAWASGGEIPEVLLADLRSSQARAHAEHLREAREHQEEKHER